MDIHRLWVVRDRIYWEAGVPTTNQVTRVAVCAVISNPLAGRVQDDVSALEPLGAQLGDQLATEALTLLSRQPISYGKAAIIGTSGLIEHGAAVIHPLMGKPIRAVTGGGKAVIPSNVKIGAAGAEIDVPLGHKDDPWSFDEIDTITISVPGAPRPDELVVIVALADGGRARPRIRTSGSKAMTANT